MTVLRAMACTGCAVSALVFSTAPIASHSWGDYHWERTTNPVEIIVANTVDGTWDAHLSVAEFDWNASSVLTIANVTGSGNARRCKTEAGTITVCNAPYGNTGWLGLAGISVSGGHITSAYAKMNDTYFSNAFYNTPEWRQMVICQEIGHGFGLDHQDENFDNGNLGTCMDYTSDPFTNQHPNDHDYAQLESIYEHSDSSGGGSNDGSGSGCNPKAPWCNGASAADILADIEMDGPAQWGRLVSKHGPQEVYELDFGRGRKIITFVTWTLEHAHNHKH